MKPIFISGNVASSKNSKQWTGKRLIWGKAAQRYRASTAMYWKLYKKDFVEACAGKQKPLRIGFFFVRDSRRKFDFCNVVQTCQDLMVEYEWLEDDNMDEMVPVPICRGEKYYHIDKDNPGVFITVL